MLYILSINFKCKPKIFLCSKWQSEFFYLHYILFFVSCLWSQWWIWKLESSITLVFCFNEFQDFDVPLCFSTLFWFSSAYQFRPKKITNTFGPQSHSMTTSLHDVCLLECDLKEFESLCLYSFVSLLVCVTTRKVKVNNISTMLHTLYIFLSFAFFPNAKKYQILE